MSGAGSAISSGVIRVMSVDDHPLLREGLAAIINSQTDMILEAEASSGKEGVELYRRNLPDVTLMDLRLPDMSGIDVINIIRSEFPKARIIILTTFEGDVEISRALAAGAKGYLLKSMVRKELLDVIRLVHAGKTRIPSTVAEQMAEHYGDDGLTAREIEVLELVAAGQRNKQIAYQLGITEETVKVHIKNILSKLDANDRTHAVLIAIRRGFLQL
ncbi:MAG TPA: response regulator transcription factor [Pyrinomonadaceae bacterium]|jgi:DNA-binding NarL/FixJ family response regulator